MRKYFVEFIYRLVKGQAMYKTFNSRYITMHGNAGAYTVGVIFGYIFFYARKQSHQRTMVRINSQIRPYFKPQTPYSRNKLSKKFFCLVGFNFLDPPIKNAGSDICPRNTFLREYNEDDFLFF